MKIYISGLHSGTNPQPGVGLARSLRIAYPDAILIGVEYSNRSSGIHWPQFDEIALQRPWEELDLPAYGERIAQLLDKGGFWISGTDLESIWLSTVFPDGHPNLLAPSAKALSKIAKPAVPAHRGLPLRIPTFISTEKSDWELHTFCRQHDWQVWLKGPYYDATRIASWSIFEAARAALSDIWSTDRLFLQMHVSGYEESVVLTAYRGELLECAQMRKRELTEVGKTWSGDVTEVSDEFVQPLREIVKQLNWTGGAELETVRDAEGQRWLLEWNPRFPAWIHGATIAGHNLPAALIEAASGIPAEESKGQAEEFTRVVLELPVRTQLPLPPLPEPFAGAVGHSQKHPSGLTVLAERLHKLNGHVRNGLTNGASGNGSSNGATHSGPLPKSFDVDLADFDFQKMATPSWLFFNRTASELFHGAATLARRLSTPECAVTNAYSLKTNPDARLIELALRHGFLAEAISLLEVQKAIATGFSPNQIILNGPGKWWPENSLPSAPLHAIFCDSIADLHRVVAAVQDRHLQAKIIGVRLRTTHIPSRFGIPMDSPDSFAALLQAIDQLPESQFGIHFHMASSHIGVRRWWHLFESMLKWCLSIQSLTGRKIDILDIGGGWFPDDWHSTDGGRFAQAVERVRALLPNVRQIISEPGKAIAQPSMALATRVLEIQGMESEETEAVIDGSIAELPMHFFYPHRILAKDAQSGEWRILKRGKTRLMGRLCMEHDELASNVALPEGTRPGDVLIFCDAGAYDRSMSYVFGRG